MKKIIWIRIPSRKYGGTIYSEKVMEILSKNYNLEVKNITSGYLGWKYLKPLEWLIDLLKIKGESDLWIRNDIYSIALQFLSRTKGKKLAVFYHLDPSVFPFLIKVFHFLIERIFYFSLRKFDAILTISDYWQFYFLKKDYKNVYKIYPGFDLTKLDISSQETQGFKRKFNLEGKPIIYIGNCQKAKGVVEVWRALKNLDVYLITSGEQRVKIPVRNLNLEYKDYLRLLRASSIAATMSKFKEGWCMTAHEAMLCKTPVIGSGKGGMRELLEGGKQIICEDFNNLREKVIYLLEHPEIRKKMGENGFNFAEKFTLERFEKEWFELIKKII